jgi:hypothetical protein
MPGTKDLIFYRSQNQTFANTVKPLFRFVEAT